MAEYPEHDKLHAVVDKSQAIGQFYEWLQQEKGVAFMGGEHVHTEERCGKVGGFWQCDYYAGQREYYHFNIQNLLAEFFEIDLKKLDNEKRAMLDELRRKVPA